MASAALGASRRRFVAAASASVEVSAQSRSKHSLANSAVAAVSGCKPARDPLRCGSPWRFLGSSRSLTGQSQTHLGAYLEQCGATWGDVGDVHQVVPSSDKKHFRWHVELPEDRLRTLRKGEPLESPPFQVKPGVNARFQLFPKGDDACVGEGTCSLWLWTDTKASLGPLKLRIGEACEREGGASDFCSLQEASTTPGSLDISLSLEEQSGAQSSADETTVSQRLHLTGLEVAEWQIFHVADLLKSGELHSSPPFRFHHVLLGDMYLELLPGVPHAEHCTLFFRCRVPTMKLQVSISAGSAFSKEFVALGRSTPEEDLKHGRCLQVNLDAPGVLGPDGSLQVKCELVKVASIPKALQDMIPKLDERALWPKRL
eukprot:TRINITY_DN125363_c0_g1_i1.p1 TRINITY_DN125363_c0_g1~~TRINITY_DN125363_c0_g1_i1.p1  ORF type:complete len:396 (-),score=50.00 TRINITY_DN125363_c0_g1_i1:40-1158(-)